MKKAIFFFLFLLRISITHLMAQSGCSTTVQFLINENLFPGINDHDTSTTYYINFGYSSGYNALHYGNIFTMNYPDTGIYNIQWDEDTLPYHVACVFPPDTSFSLTADISYCPPADSTCYPADADCDTSQFYDASGNSLIHFEDSLDEQPECLPTVLYDSCIVVSQPPCVTAEGQVSIMYGNNCNSTNDHVLDKPLIFVEGIDFGNQTFINGKYGDFGWPEFSTGIDWNAADPLSTRLMPDLIAKLRAEGFDIILLDFKDGATYIQANAMLLVKLINTINKKLQDNNSKHEIVLTAASMGGLVAKYALSYMENNHINSNTYTPGAGNNSNCDEVTHNVRLFLTFDSPHTGANIPIGDQLLFYFMRTLKSFKPEIGLANTKLDRPAVKQLLLYNKSNIDNHIPGPHSLRTQLVNDINHNFPVLPRKVSIANGSCKGTLQNGNDGTLLYEYTEMINIWKEFYGLARVKAKVWSTPAYTSSWYPLYMTYNARIEVIDPIAGIPIVYPGWRRLKNMYNYDGASGGYRSTNKPLDEGNSLFGIQHDAPTNFPRHCFIPTVSALALKQSTPELGYDVKNNLFKGTDRAYFPAVNDTTPFNALYAPDENQAHIEITAQNIGWVMGEVSPPNLYLQNKTMNHAAVYEARDTIFVGYDVDTVKTPTVRTLPGDYVITPDCGDVTLRAGDEITLTDGFWAQQGSLFDAYIEPFPCDTPVTGSYKMSNTPPPAPKKKKAEEKQKQAPVVHYYNGLQQNTPNPVSTITDIAYSIKDASTVSITLYNIYGQAVGHLADAVKQEAGTYKITFDATNLTYGIYFYTLEVQGKEGVYKETKRMVVLK